jgi:glycine betaine transporter
MTLPRRILVATDFSESSEQALDYALALASRLDAKVYLLNVIGLPLLGVADVGIALTSSMIDALIRGNRSELERLVERRAPARVEILLKTGDVRDVIVSTADSLDIDLIVMGTHGRRGVGRALLGSVAEGVLRHAHCPVLTIRQPRLS